MSTTDFLGVAGQNKVRIAGLAVISAALPVTVYMALTPQTFQNRAIGTEVASLEVIPSDFIVDVSRGSIPLSAQVLDSGNSLTTVNVFYEWNVNSAEGVGSLTNITGNNTEFQPQAPGCGQITVTARGGEQVLTETVNVTVTNGTYVPDC